MSASSHEMAEGIPSVRAEAKSISRARLLYWSVRRELWENRSVYIAPLAAAGMFLVGLAFLPHHLHPKVRGGTWIHDAILQPHMFAAGLMMFVGMIVGAQYCLSAFYNERRDRSILFWKSMPVSDTIAVLAKASVPILILPAITAVAGVATQFLMLLMQGAAMSRDGMGVAALWSELDFSHMALIMFYHLIIVHGLWHAPFYGWILMVSSWAKRATLMWTVLPGIAIVFLEKLLFGSSHFVAMLYYLSAGGDPGPSDGSMMDMLGHLELWQMMRQPGLWTGLAVTAIFLAVAVRLRKSRGPL